MTQRIVQSPHDHVMAQRYVESLTPPYTLSVRMGKNRSIEQNRLQRLWMNEIAEQRPEKTAEEWRAHCKLHFGVPILRAEDDHFCAEYDRLIRPMDYEDKLSIMAVPLDFPVTRLMSTKQKTHYLDAIYVHFNGLGVVLTEPGP